MLLRTKCWINLDIFTISFGIKHAMTLSGTWICDVGYIVASGCV